MTSHLTVRVYYGETRLMTGGKTSLMTGHESLWVEGTHDAIAAALAPWPGTRMDDITGSAWGLPDFILPAGAFALHLFLRESLGDPP